MRSNPVAGQNLFGTAVRQRAPNEVAAWRYVAFALVVVIACLYALPNLYPPDYALQVSADNAAVQVDEAFLGNAETRLEVAGIAVKGSEMVERAGRPGALLRLESNEAQLRASALLDAALNPAGEERRYIIALSLASTTPQWLANIGGKPMAKGLDLAGGIHFVLQVDMVEALAKRLGDELQKAKDVLREERLRYRSPDDAVMTGDVNAIQLGFSTPSSRERAIEVLEEEFREPDYVIDEATVDGFPGLTVTVQDSKLDEIESTAIEQNLTGLRNRVNQLGVSEPLVQRLGGSRIVIDLPGVQDSARAKRILDKFANLEFRLVSLPEDRPSEVEDWIDEDGRPVTLQRDIIVTGDSVTNAVQSRDPETGLPQVNISLDSRGGEQMHEATSPNVGHRMATIFIEQKPVVVTEVVDGERIERRSTRQERRVISVATIQSPLAYNFRVTGLGLAEAQELALLLRAGALAAPMYFVEERTVGASLGDENIERGMLAVSVGFVMVLIFMAVYYKVFGLVANVALTLNLVILVAVMSLLNATLTLPGIAGIVLTVGMAVDANVLIFSRIREELKRSPPAVAIQAGYDRAFLTILDANVTTLFVALILYAIGSGPVAGFAVTLSIGIVTSMFTAIFGSRVLVHLIYGRRKLTRVLI
ncbi:MAG: protein translocase subunit SecD [Gammaproteobacteria bacterium]|nr:protein translocase subunit SecD [Gammaproteobacteria bacterium]